MESSKSGSAPDPFMRQLLHNNMLMFAVLMAVCTVAILGVGLYMLLVR